ncbi:MAG: Very short patch repair protein [Pelotomaculum sp. PtaU1.Bin065]|nr:MAG: Very short patch repair protein [Pelotomaculum sp. PtaU1.Bin065]
MKKKQRRDSATISKIMSAVKQKNTYPELVVRKIIRSSGYKFHVHPKELAGKPDIVLNHKKKAIFVNGCFWHNHGCTDSHLPSVRKEYWIAKFRRNKTRDKTVNKQLRKEGWKTFTVWECNLKNVPLIKKKLLSFLRDKA